jgi:hypothetical protein
LQFLNEFAVAGELAFVPPAVNAASPFRQCQTDNRKLSQGGSQVMPRKSADERRSARANVLLVAAVECGGVRIPVRVVNLSAHGALVLGEVIPSEDSPVIFRCNGLVVEGWIAWVRPPHAGIHFSATIQPGKALSKTPATGTMIIKDSRRLDYRRPGFRGNQLTAEEKHIVEHWNKERPQLEG